MVGKKSDYTKAKSRAKLSSGDVIRVACDMLNINQAELAKRSGVPASHVSAIIAGKKTIGRVVAQKIADALEISPGNILFAGEAARKGSYVAQEIEKHAKTLRTQQNKINALVERALSYVNKLEKSNVGLKIVQRNLKQIQKINEEEDIAGFYTLAKKALEEGKDNIKG